MAITLDNLIHTYVNLEGISVVRLGNVETNALLNYPHYAPPDMFSNAGFYGDNEIYKKWRTLYTSAIIKSDFYLDVITCPSFKICGELLMKLNIWKPTLPYMELDFKFWEKLVSEIGYIDNRITIVSYFVEVMKSQLKNLENIFPWMAKINFTFVKSYNTTKGNEKHKDWLTTYNDLKKRVDKTNAKYVFLSCGCYGLPLCQHLKEKGRNPFYVGGFLQLLFGLKGKRWDERQGINEHFTNHWKYPTHKPKNCEQVENWCYGQ